MMSENVGGQGVHPDAELLQACADYHVAFNKTRHLDPDVNDPNGPVWNAASDAWTDAMKRVTAAKPKTVEGLRAKALVVATEVHDASIEYSGGHIDDAQRHERLAYSLAQDVLGWAS